jgi:hypothetical protein
MNQSIRNIGQGTGAGRRRTIASLLLALVLTIALLASAAPVSSGGPPYLAVTSATPAANTLDVSAGANVTVVFDYAVNGATVTEDTFNVDGSLSGPVVGTYTGGGTTAITFDYTSNFEAGETVTITLTLAIEGLDGRTLEYPVTWQFVVETSYSYFTDSGQLLGDSDSNGVSLGDLDGDGDLDAFVANAYHHANRVWLNNGNGYFTDSGQLLGDSDSRGVSLGDLDGDGDLDAFVANNPANSVWRNNGDGYFTDSGQLLGISGSYGVSLGDLDGDGDIDALVGNYFGYDRVWRNNGDGYFTGGQSLGIYPSSYGVALGDLDGDGDLDALAVKWNYLNDIIWLNDGNSTFTQGQTLEGEDSNGVALGDIDEDGDLDALVIYYRGRPVFRVWLNNGNGEFYDSGQLVDLSNSSNGVALGDLDGDGDLDAFFANDGADKVWLNVRPPQYGKGYQDGLAACAATYLDTMPPSGSVHAHDNFLWTRNGKTAEVTLSGYVRDELSIARDGGGIGISSAYLLIDGTKVTLTLDPDGTFEVTRGFTCSKGTVYTVELYAADTTPAADGGPNSGLVDSTCVRVR